MPPRDGAMVRMYHVLRHLSEKHQVRQFSQPRISQFLLKDLAKEVRGTPSYLEYRYKHPIPAFTTELSRRLWVGVPMLSGLGLRICRPRRLREWLGWADVIVVEFPWQFAYCWRNKGKAPIVLVNHNLEASKFVAYAEAAGTSVNNSYLYRQAVALEREAVTRADLVVAVSPEERSGLAEYYDVDPARIVVVPNGADVSHYAPVDAPTKRSLKRKLGLPDRPTVIYLAGVSNAPRKAGLAWVRRTADVLKDYGFLVLGPLFRRPTVQGNLIATGIVEDPKDYVHASDFSLCPIQHGGGTKIKIFETLAAGLPTVVFAESIRGTSLRHEEHVLVADKNEEDLSSALRRLVTEGNLAQRLTTCGRRFVVENHDWKKIADQFESILTRLIDSTGAPARQT